MAFPLSYKKKLVLPSDTPKDYSEKLLKSFCIALNKERKCKADLKGNKIEFKSTSWNIMSWRVFSFINEGDITAKTRSKDVEININLDTTLSAIVVLFLSSVFAILTNINEGHLATKSASVSLICAWSFLYFINRFVSVMYFNSLLKTTYRNIS